jgi:hypothetical protein
MRGAPQSTFSMLIRRISARRSVPICGRPPSKVDVIFARGAWALAAAKNATRTIPIAGIDLEIDPVEAGLVASIARPGGNITGMFLDCVFTQPRPEAEMGRPLIRSPHRRGRAARAGR